MKRRDSLKALTISSLGLAGFAHQEVLAETMPKQLDVVQSGPDNIDIPAGRLKEEAIRDAELMKQKFFTDHELATITILSDIIIPKDATSGSASEAGVTDFIEFIAKDMPQHQTPLRGGLRWLDVESNKRFKKDFVKLSASDRLKIVDDIAYPADAKPEFTQGAAFFSLMRNLTATGFYTSEIGIKDIGYMGNTPNMWEGVPPEVLKQYNLKY